MTNCIKLQDLMIMTVYFKQYFTTIYNLKSSIFATFTEIRFTTKKKRAKCFTVENVLLISIT